MQPVLSSTDYVASSLSSTDYAASSLSSTDHASSSLLYWLYISSMCTFSQKSLFLSDQDDFNVRQESQEEKEENLSYYQENVCSNTYTHSVCSLSNELYILFKVRRNQKSPPPPPPPPCRGIETGPAHPANSGLKFQ